jgi:hypothetical protein
LRAREALSTFFHIMKLTFSFPGLIAGFYLRRRRAVKRFREEMIACGVPPGEAKELARMYSFGIGDIMKLARGFSEA